MIKSGLKPYKWQSHKDYDFLASHKFGALPPTLPDNFCTDAGFWQPNQEETLTYAVAGFDSLTVPAMPYGCTDWMGTDLCVDEDKKLYNPLDIENITHANARQGAQLKDALDAVRSLAWAKQYFSIKASGSIDWFDAIRLGSYSAQPEVRSVGIGTPFFPEFLSPLDNGILPIPTNFDVSRATWHAWKIAGWKTIGDQVYLVGKPWIGAQYADKGFCYISRPLINQLLSISGTSAWVLSDLPPEDIQTVSLTVVQNIVSWFLNSFFPTIKSQINTQPVQPTTPHVSRIPDWAKAIEANEGANAASNNPGNLKYASLTASWGATKGRAATDGGFLCQFSTYEQGFQALCNFLTLGAENQLIAFHKARTLQAFTEVYAGNPPQAYIDRIGKALGVPLTIDVSELL